jgi:hypothetical protein
VPDFLNVPRAFSLSELDDVKSRAMTNGPVYQKHVCVWRGRCRSHFYFPYKQASLNHIHSQLDYLKKKMWRPTLIRFFFSHSELYLHPHVARPDTKASIVLFYPDPHQTPIKIFFRPVYCVRTSSVEMRIQYFFPPLVAAAIHMLLLRKKTTQENIIA